MSQFEEEQTVEDLITTLSAQPWQTRSQAADALIRVGEPAVGPLMQAIRNARFAPHNLPLAVRALGGIGDERAVPLLIDILASDYVHAVQEAAISLGYIGTPEAIEPLINVFRQDWDDEETITAWLEASGALAAIGEVALVPLIGALQDTNSAVRCGVIDALGQLGDTRAVDPLVSMLQDEDRQVRADAAKALGKIGDQHAVEPLVALFSDEDGYVRYCACYALGDICVVSAYEALISVLHDADPDVRSAAVVNLGRMQGMDLLGFVRDLHPERHHATVEELKRTQGEHTLNLLLGALKDPDAGVRAAAARTLGKVGDERVMPALLWVQQNDAGSDRIRVKEDATWAIQHLQEQHQKSS